MSTADQVFNRLLQSYASAVNASDSAAYIQNFAQDAIRMPPGANPEYGLEAIQRGEQADYDVARWAVKMTPRDVLAIAEDWVYGIADVEVSTVAHADGLSSNFRLTATWLLHRDRSGSWLIQRQMWNRKPDKAS
ncbi:YybH family protein [Lyngbya confervoides]|uniref:Nuclear transport factor 2 family protein n=1 Tax=Lyngbya confervoides BDU141951 TaxID=1574623 RepID=A0ABD4SZ46_9CYAN|nr:nuclear transport factor 2 family protein [Lyngbya confervoides]MCM1981741.1 nuclear transport factor 2 family protein [Lyngbya confervoides BDU141951]